MGFVTEENRKMSADGKYVYLNSIIPAGKSVNKINSLGGMSAKGVTKNEELGEELLLNNKRLQKLMEESWGEEEGGDSGNNIDTSKYNN